MEAKYSWLELKPFHYNAPINPPIRSQEYLNKYIEHKKQLKLLNISMADYIYKKYLNGKKYKFTLNNFPYNLADHIQHYILWLDPKTKKNKINDRFWIDKIITISFPNKEYICWQNIKNNQSIPHIPHYQLFIKK